MKVEILKKTRVAGKRCKKGDKVDCSQECAVYLVTRGIASAADAEAKKVCGVKEDSKAP